VKQLNILNLTKVNGIHETKPEKNYETKRNFTPDETKRNETKRNFAVFIVSRNKRNFAKRTFCFALFRVSRNKKSMRNGNPNQDSLNNHCQLLRNENYGPELYSIVMPKIPDYQFHCKKWQSPLKFSFF
jgi:hypothetical protein